MANKNLFFEIKPEQFALARKILSLKQQDIARLVNLSVSSYNGIETGKVDPKLSTYVRIIDFFVSNNITFCENGNVIRSKE